jgi:hypothetical protein
MGLLDSHHLDPKDLTNNPNKLKFFRGYQGPWLEAVVKPTWTTKLRESTICIYIGMKLPKLLPTPHFKDTHIDELKKPLGYGSDGPTNFSICGNKT